MQLAEHPQTLRQLRVDISHFLLCYHLILGTYASEIKNSSAFTLQQSNFSGSSKTLSRSGFPKETPKRLWSLIVH